MKLIRYTLTADGKVPNEIINGGFFAKSNGNQSPQDYDLIGYSVSWTGLEEYTDKTTFENYIKSFNSDATNPDTGETSIVQDLIDNIWSNKGD